MLFRQIPILFRHPLLCPAINKRIPSTKAIAEGIFPMRKKSLKGECNPAILPMKGNEGSHYLLSRMGFGIYLGKMKKGFSERILCFLFEGEGPYRSSWQACHQDDSGFCRLCLPWQRKYPWEWCCEHNRPSA